jgi:anti-sigma B factor antagonist
MPGRAVIASFSCFRFLCFRDSIGGLILRSGLIRRLIMVGWSQLKLIPYATRMKMAIPSNQQSINIERHGDIAVITPSSEVEKMPENLMEQAAQMVLAPLKDDPPAGLIFDLSKVDYVGSVFLSFLLRCHKRVKEHGSEVVVAGASPRARELLHMTALDTLWALYETRGEAMEALGGD